MNRLVFAACAGGLLLAGINPAKADFVFDIACSGSTCTQGSSVGTLTIQEFAADGTTPAADGSAAKIVYTVTLPASGGGTIHQNNNGTGLTTFFADVTGTVSGVSTNPTSGWTGITSSSGLKTDGLSTNGNPAPPTTWDVGANCKSACGTSVTVTITGTNLGVGSVELPQGTQNFQVFAGLDVDCTNNVCGTNSPVTNTGVVGATASPVPGPIFGGGLPGLIAACAGLVVFARRRRFRFV